jgi:hypothetical protein
VTDDKASRSRRTGDQQSAVIDQNCLLTVLAFAVALVVKTGVTAARRVKNTAARHARALLVLELPGIEDAVLGVVELDRLPDPRLVLREIGHEVAVGPIDANGQVAVVHLPRDGALAGA